MFLPVGVVVGQPFCVTISFLRFVTRGKTEEMYGSVGRLHDGALSLHAARWVWDYITEMELVKNDMGEGKKMGA